MERPADPRRPSHYFRDPEVAPRRRRVEVSLPDVALSLWSDRGVFSADRLDPGTKLLLLEAPPIAPAERVVLDLGCGWGPVACVTALRAPWARIHAVDVNERARELTRDNAAEAGVGDRVEVAAPDDVDDALRFDRILSNPPVRIGKPALQALLERWLTRLGPAGRAHLVVHRHLGGDSLARHLAERGHPVTRLAGRAGYRVLEVRPREGR